MAASRSTMWEEDGDNDQYDDVKSASTSKLPSPFLDDHEPLTVSKSRVPPWLWAYIPFLVWIIVSILTGLAVALFHTEVFGALETFSHHMKESGLTGYAIFFAAIAFTCIPPMRASAFLLPYPTFSGFRAHPSPSSSSLYI